MAAEFARPAILYSGGKDSSVLLHVARKAFYPERIPLPVVHIDTGFKFPEIYEFRDRICREMGVDLRVYRNESAVAQGMNPAEFGTVRCCAALKTQALLGAIRDGRFDALVGGARRSEERARAKERIFSLRGKEGQWDPENQRPELWTLYNGRLREGESMRVFPLSNWTESDIWKYVRAEHIAVASLYFAERRQVVRRKGELVPVYPGMPLSAGEQPETVQCRFRSLGCMPCTGAVESAGSDIDAVVSEIEISRISERATRAIDHDIDGSMELKKREGYF